jgi:hypothetical protein
MLSPHDLLRGDLRAPQVAKSSPMPALSRAGLRSAGTTIFDFYILMLQCVLNFEFR